MDSPSPPTQAPSPKPHLVDAGPSWQVRLRRGYERIRRLQGDPHYVAMGMGIGVFVAVTPTIPFHTIIAVALAFILRGSKPAAIIGVWFSNPVTIPLLYYGSYKVGALLMPVDLPAEIPYESITAMLDLGADVTLAMMLGGCVLGILPALIAYSLTWRLVCRLRKDGVCETGLPTSKL
ncbi:MAG: DUF2062 domain-containing protein [Desulfosarcinaceae bacterium]|nr:DUF2062 domain-containing protein [Desulfosarcinaceae bacterium]